MMRISHFTMLKEIATNFISVFLKGWKFIISYSMNSNSVMDRLQELRRISEKYGDEIHRQAENAKPFSFNDIFDNMCF